MAAADTQADGGGDTYVITYLEMEHRPVPPPHPPANAHIALIRAENPPAHYFEYLYGTVGAAYAWTDWFDAPPEDRESFVSDPNVALYTLLVDGWPGGFFMLDTREAGVCDLAYFGLMPQAVGRGLGRWFLGTAIQTGWDGVNVTRLTVNTCTLDNPRALPLYQQSGFKPVRRVTAARKVVEKS